MMTKSVRDAALAAINEQAVTVYGDEKLGPKLSSGRQSRLFVDMPRAYAGYKDREAIATLLASMYENIAADYGKPLVCGMATGGIPLAVSVADCLAAPVCYIKKDGTIAGAEVKGRPVLLLEDVTTTGGTMLFAAESLARQGGLVVGCFVVLDRSCGELAQNVEKTLGFFSALKGCQFQAAFALSDLDIPQDVLEAEHAAQRERARQ